MINQESADRRKSNDAKALIRLLLWAEGQAEDLNGFEVQKDIESARKKLQSSQGLTEFDVLN